MSKLDHKNILLPTWDPTRVTQCQRILPTGATDEILQFVVPLWLCVVLVVVQFFPRFKPENKTHERTWTRWTCPSPLNPSIHKLPKSARATRRTHQHKWMVL